jgi:hypothetical protein
MRSSRTVSVPTSQWSPWRAMPASENTWPNVLSSSSSATRLPAAIWMLRRAWMFHPGL